MRYEIVAATYRDLERSTGRIALIDRLAGLFGETPTDLLPTVALLCQGQIAPDFAGVELGLAERMAARAVAQVAGTTAEQVLAGAREVGDLGLTAEQLLGELDPDRPASLEVVEVFEGLHEIARADLCELHEQRREPTAPPAHELLVAVCFGEHGAVRLYRPP